MAKTIFISTVFGYANKGDWALLNSLKRILLSYFPDCKIFGVCKNAKIQAQIIPDIEWIEQMGSSNKAGIARQIFIILGYLKALWLILVFPFSKNRYVTALKQSDLIISCPGGYLHDANKSIVTLFFNYLLCLRSHKKIIFAPQSIGPIYNPIFRKIVKRILKKATYIFVRESYSYEYCIKTLNLPPDKVIEILDMAFYDLSTTSIDNKGIRLPQQFITSTLIKWLYPTVTNPTSMHERYLKELSIFYNHILRSTDYSIVFLKQIENVGEDYGDNQLVEEIMKRLYPNYKDRVIFISQFITPEEMKEIISKSKCLIGSRMHSNIFALTVNTPVIAISYQPKTEFIMKSLGLSRYSLNINNFTSTQLITTFSELNNYPNFSKKIAVKREHALSTLEESIKGILY